MTDFSQLGIGTRVKDPRVNGKGKLLSSSNIEARALFQGNADVYFYDRYGKIHGEQFLFLESEKIQEKECPQCEGVGHVYQRPEYDYYKRVTCQICGGKEIEG